MSDATTQSDDSPSGLIIWFITDEKPGHANQAIGLIRALEQRLPIETHTVTAPPPARAWTTLLMRSSAFGRDLPDPDLIIGVGHQTHPVMLAARADRGGRTIVLMRPTLPLAMFDLAIIPEHDAPKSRSNVITTRGVLNAIVPSSNQDAGRGLILLGGPSKHAAWSDEAIATQVGQVVRNSPNVTWHLTTSRRSPGSTAGVMQSLDMPNLKVTPAEATPPGWVAEQLAACKYVWVSADSVSMVYEALTAGACVGILHVSPRQKNRVSAGLDALLADGMVRSFEEWQQTGELPPSRRQLNEAARCAELIVEHWLPTWRNVANT